MEQTTDNLTLESTFTLANGKTIPVLGLGVWKMAEGSETEEAVTWALEAGYRHIDTARLYANERSVGNAVRRFMEVSGTPREDIFVTTKLWPSDYFNPEAAFTESLEKLDLEYIDLYLIHWPVPLMPKKIWQTFEKVYEQGLAKSIGVSNYSESDIEKLLSYANVAPMVNQVEFNPADYDLALLEYCKSKDIVVEAYSPLGQGGLVKNKTILSVAEKYKKSPAQILIRWALQHGTVVIPKSSNKERIKENTEVFDLQLSEQDMQTLNALG
jgi:methylglyoxal/glyoxal reductase